MSQLSLRTITDAPDEIKGAPQAREGGLTLGWERGSMDRQHRTTVGRRDLLWTLTAVGVAAAAIAGADRPEAAEPANSNRGKRRSLYQANSAEVKTFYRVNSYPAH